MARDKVNDGARAEGERRLAMARRSWLSIYAQMQREAARKQAAQVRAQSAARREADKAERAHAAYVRAQAAADVRAQAADVRAQAATEKERKRLYIESRAAHVAAMNADLENTTGALQGFLAASLRAGDLVSFSSLKNPASKPLWHHADLERAEPAPVRETFMPAPPSGLGKLFSQAKHERATEEGLARFAQAAQEHRNREAQRGSALKKARAEWQAAAAQLEKAAKKQREQVGTFEAAYRRGDRDAVVSYCSMVLEASAYPDGFPQRFKFAYVPESRQAVVEYELPTVDVVPTVKAYRYVKQSDSIAESARPQSQTKALYASVVAQVAIRTVHELLKSDKAGHIDTVVFNGLVDTTDPGSGQRIRPCLVTVRATRESFSQLDLHHVEPLACLKHLSAGVSKSPAELLPVRPVLEFNMVDPRFVAESDALSELDQRPNLMELSWLEFEALIQNLFVKMGLEARQTRASRDGGVDCVAWDPRPIFGGKVVIQAKRYKNTVGVSAVRDLFGTLQNEGASKGILVTTSGYGQASFDFAKNKPIELIDGSNLLYLLAEHTGIEAKIVPPDDWKDPIADMPGPDT
jgi:restriction system protein